MHACVFVTMCSGAKPCQEGQSTRKSIEFARSRGEAKNSRWNSKTSARNNWELWWNYPNRNTDAPIRWRMMERGDYNINSVIRIKFPFISYQRLIVTLLLCGGLLDFFWSFCCLVLVNNCIFFIPEWSLFDVIMMSYKGWFNFIYFLIKKITSWYQDFYSLAYPPSED